MADRASTSLGATLGGGRGGALERFLDRFRRSSGVPTPAGADLAAELLPLFSLLDAIEAEAAGVRRATAAAVGAERDRVTEEVEALLADARQQAEAEAAEAAKAARRAAATEAREIVAAGEAEAERIRAAASERAGPLAAEVCRRILAFPEERS